MADDDLLARADKHRTAGDGYLCIHCGERWPCTTSDLAAALRAAREREAIEADDFFWDRVERAMMHATEKDCAAIRDLAAALRAAREREAIERQAHHQCEEARRLGWQKFHEAEAKLRAARDEITMLRSTWTPPEDD